MAVGHKRWRVTAVHCLVVRSTVHQVRTSLVVGVACTARTVIHLSPFLNDKTLETFSQPYLSVTLYM